MQITKRDGTRQAINFNKIATRIRKLTQDLDKKHVDVTMVAQNVIAGAYDGITTKELDALAAETAATMATDHPDYTLLAGRLAVSMIHKEVQHDFFQGLQRLKEIGRLADETLEVAEKHREAIEAALDYDKDYQFDYFGIKTLERSYLIRDADKVIIERPQDMYMRVAIGIHGDDIDNILRTYELLSDGIITHATPTLFNAGTNKAQMSSCFLLDMAEDSLTGIYKTLDRCAQISKHAGGIGVSVNRVRGKGTYISGTGGHSNGLVPMLKVFNATAKYVDQGGGKRKGSIAVYVEPWHPDVMDFLDLKKPHGAEDVRARDLFYAMWANDLFFKRVVEDGQWSLFDPSENPQLGELYGEAFEAEYERLEAEGVARHTMKARDLWAKITASQIETGTPYVLAKDTVNKTSMQENLGTIKSSNLCAEIVEYTDENEVAVCNLASIALPKFVTEEGYDYDALIDTAYAATVNLNRIIDRNYYPVSEAEYSNLKHRPIGLGIQGLADVFAKMKVSFDSREAREINHRIFEAIYYGAVNASIDLAAKEGPYPTYEGSPWSQGDLHIDRWLRVSESFGTPASESFALHYDWDTVRERVKAIGVRNSLLTALMPTASTSQILGNNECFEPFTNNLYIRRTLSGEFVVVNKYLIRDLVEIGMWDNDMKNRLLAANGSVQEIFEIPQEIRDRYKTVWEVPQKALVDLAADRAKFIDQTQSMNLFFSDPNQNKISSALMYGWKRGLKTLNYYIRSNSAVDAVKFTVAKKREEAPAATETASAVACSLDNPESCDSCGA